MRRFIDKSYDVNASEKSERSYETSASHVFIETRVISFSDAKIRKPSAQIHPSWIFSSSRRESGLSLSERSAKDSTSSYPSHHWVGPDGSGPRYPTLWPRPYGPESENARQWLAGFDFWEDRDDSPSACVISLGATGD